MRLFEFDDTKSKLIGLVTHLKGKAQGKESAKVRTKSFLKMLRNLGISMDVASLNNLLDDTDSGVNNHISSADDEYIELNLSGDAPEDDFMGGDEGGDDLDLGLDGEGGDDLDLGMDDGMGDEEVGATTDDFEEPEMGDTAAQSPQQKVQNMAKSALSRRQ